MDVGTLVKKGSDVLVSTRNAVKAPDLENSNRWWWNSMMFWMNGKKWFGLLRQNWRQSLVRRLVELK